MQGQIHWDCLGLSSREDLNCFGMALQRFHGKHEGKNLIFLDTSAGSRRLATGRMQDA